MLDGEKLGEEIWKQLSGNEKADDPDQPVNPTEEHWKKVGKAIVAHFKTNGVIPLGIKCSGSATTDPGRIQ